MPVQTPRITVLTPNYNDEPYLEAAICSVLDQDCDDLEFIIIDGGSTDGSAEIIRRYENELAFWFTRSNEGPADAINQALTHATGDIIVILRSIDRFLPYALNEVIRRMQAEDSPSWLVGGIEHIGEHEQFEGSQRASAPESFAAFLMHDSGFLPLAASFFRRSCIRCAGWFDPRFGLAMDYEFCCRLMATGFTPTVIERPLTAQEQCAQPVHPRRVLRTGLQYLCAAERYGPKLPLRQRYELWTNLDRRRRIYALAQAELAGPASHRVLLNELVRHPWWLTNDAIRRMLSHGVEHPLPDELTRAAA